MKTANVFICQTCSNGKEYTPEEIVIHLQEVHHIDAKKPTKREPIMFSDGPDFYKQTYKWFFPRVVLLQKVTGKRGEAV